MNVDLASGLLNSFSVCRIRRCGVGWLCDAEKAVSADLSDGPFSGAAHKRIRKVSVASGVLTTASIDLFAFL